MVRFLKASQVTLVGKNPSASAGDVRGTGLIPGSPTLQADSLPSGPPGKPLIFPRDASSAKTRGVHTQLDEGPETP